MLLHLAAAALAGSRVRVSNVLFVVVRRYYVSSWICGRSRGTDDSASFSKPPLSFLTCIHFNRHNATDKSPLLTHSKITKQKLNMSLVYLIFNLLI